MVCVIFYTLYIKWNGIKWNARVLSPRCSAPIRPRGMTVQTYAARARRKKGDARSRYPVRFRVLPIIVFYEPNTSCDARLIATLQLEHIAFFGTYKKIYGITYYPCELFQDTVLWCIFWHDIISALCTHCPTSNISRVAVQKLIINHNFSSKYNMFWLVTHRQRCNYTAFDDDS